MNAFYINLSTIFICVDVVISIKGVKQVTQIKKNARVARTEAGVHDVDFKEYPYVVRYEALQAVLDPTRSYKNKHICSGSALSPSSTLTAALCCATTGDSTKTVVKSGDKSSEVLKCTVVVGKRGISHPMMMSDLAILTTEPVMVTAYGRVSAIDFDTLAGQHVSVLGYGLMDDGAGRRQRRQNQPPPLQRLDGMWSKCSDDVVYPVMCVAGTCGAKDCVKDSGGPVVHDGGIVGVSTLATGFKCGHANRISTIDFIYPVGSTVDIISSLVENIEIKNKHKYFQ